jgi:hypothetical protein
LPETVAFSNQAFKLMKNIPFFLLYEAAPLKNVFQDTMDRYQKRK